MGACVSLCSKKNAPPIREPLSEEDIGIKPVEDTPITNPADLVTNIKRKVIGGYDYKDIIDTDRNEIKEAEELFDNMVNDAIRKVNLKDEEIHV